MQFEQTGFNEPQADDAVVRYSHSGESPWMNWDEWNFVYESLFSSSPDSVASALQRISGWRSRRVFPFVEVTASIIEIQQNDPYFRNDLSEGAFRSEEMLSMLYCMAIVRLVNISVEKTRKKTKESIWKAADAIGIPRMLIDIRHEGSHRDLPSIKLLRIASIKALDWLKSYYWEPYKEAIPVHSDQSATVRNEIKQRLLELSFSLKLKQTACSISSQVKEKRVRHIEHLYGRNKFFFRMAGKMSNSKSLGFKKQVSRSLKNVLGLYSTFSSEVVYVMLDLMLKALDVSGFQEDTSVSCSIDDEQTIYDDWKSVVLKLSNKEPEFLLTLLKAVLERIETLEAAKYELGEHGTPERLADSQQLELLSFLFAWLVKSLKTIDRGSKREAVEINGSQRALGKDQQKTIILEIMRKCLLVSSPGRTQLMNSALVLAEVAGDKSLLHKLKKLNSLYLQNSDSSEENTVPPCTESLLYKHETFLHEAAEKFERIRLHRAKSVNSKTPDTQLTSSRWVLSKWPNSCPIGMLPHNLGVSGRFPVLDYNDISTGYPNFTDDREHDQVNQSCGKREADRAIEELDNARIKKPKETGADHEPYDEDESSSEGVKGHLMIDGDWRKVGEDDLRAIASAIRIFSGIETALHC